MTEKIQITDTVLAVEAQALAEYYRNRALVSGQRYFDMVRNCDDIAAERDEVKAELERVTAVPAVSDADNSLAQLLRIFIAEGAMNEASVVRLRDDAKRVIEGDA